MGIQPGLMFTIYPVATVRKTPTSSGTVSFLVGVNER
jgi:hypothetical protein